MFVGGSVFIGRAEILKSFFEKSPLRPYGRPVQESGTWLKCHEHLHISADFSRAFLDIHFNHLYSTNVLQKNINKHILYLKLNKQPEISCQIQVVKILKYLV
jgi:hypothetical protein